MTTFSFEGILLQISYVEMICQGEIITSENSRLNTYNITMAAFMWIFFFGLRMYTSIFSWRILKRKRTRRPAMWNLEPNFAYFAERYWIGEQSRKKWFRKIHVVCYDFSFAGKRLDRQYGRTDRTDPHIMTHWIPHLLLLWCSLVIDPVRLNGIFKKISGRYKGIILPHCNHFAAF